MFFFFQAEDGIRDGHVTGVQTCALPILDGHIVKEKGLEGQDLLDKKILALQVELGELANELPETFKFWSDKKNNCERALKELVDCLHFTLSIGLEIGVKPDEVKDLLIWNSPGVDQLNSLFAYTSELYTFVWSVEYTKKEMKSKYKNLLEGLLGFGVDGLLFTWEQIEQAYYKKNKINHERQKTGY